MAQEVNRIPRRVFQDTKRLRQVDLEGSEMAGPVDVFGINVALPEIGGFENKHVRIHCLESVLRHLFLLYVKGE